MHILRGKDGPEFVARLYEAFRVKRPFGSRSWRLPPAGEVVFKVTRNRNFIGEYSRVNGRHVVGLSDARIGHLHTLSATLVHEMVHLVQAVNGTETSGAEHNADFQRRAGIVCKAFGFDPKEFSPWV